jgi:hypothetical protein
LGHTFGLVGGGLLVLGGILSLAFGMADLILGHPRGMIGAVSSAVVLFVLGGLTLMFAWLGRHEWRARAWVAGVLLVVIGLLGWATVGSLGDVATLVGALFAVLAGVLYLLEPSQKVFGTLVRSVQSDS